MADALGDDAELYEVESARSVVVAQKDDHIAGVALAIKNPLHPHYLRSQVVVAPPYRRMGLGHELHRGLLAWLDVKDEEYGLDASCYHFDTRAQKFLLSIGYTHIFDTYIVDIQPIQSNERTGSSIVSLMKYYNEGGSKKVFRDFIIKHYEREHKMNRPLDISSREWDEYVIDNINLELSVIYVFEGKILGACTAECLSPNALDIDWCYASFHLPHGVKVSILCELLHYPLNLAYVRGIRHVSMEILSSNKALMEMRSKLPVCGEAIYRRYRLPITKNSAAGFSGG